MPIIKRQGHEPQRSSEGLFFSVQRKPLADAQDGTQEREADKVADTVVRHNQPSILGTQPFFKPVNRVPAIQKQSEQNTTPAQANTPTHGLETTLQSTKGQGASMDSKTKEEMESGFGHNFSDVSIHTDDKAVQMSQDLGAQAFTSGNHIYFNKGKYNPSSQEGKHLLAHELTHTVQQGGGQPTKSVQMKSEGGQQKASAQGLDPLKVVEYDPLTLTQRQKAQFKASVLAETSHGLSGLHDIAWIYFSRITDKGWASAMDGSSAFKSKNENYKLWMYYQGQGSAYKDFNYRGEGKLSDYVKNNEWFTGTIEPRGKAYMKWMDEHVFVEHPKHKYGGWHGQGFWGDFNRNPSEGKGDQWYQARQYYLLQLEGKVTKRYVTMLEELHGDGQIKDQTSFIFDVEAVVKYFKDNPKMLPAPEKVKKYTYGEGKKFKR